MGKMAPLRQCPACGSTDRVQRQREPIPGGTDWRYFVCTDCEYEWRV